MNITRQTKRYIYYKDKVFYNRITKNWYVPIEKIARKLESIIERYFEHTKGSRNYAYNNKLWNLIHKL